MRPKSNKKDIPSSHDISVYVHNKCVEWLDKLKYDILVSVTLKITLQCMSHSLINCRLLLAGYRPRRMDGPQIIPEHRSWG
jgi:hypothetical protein